LITAHLPLSALLIPGKKGYDPNQKLLDKQPTNYSSTDKKGKTRTLTGVELKYERHWGQHIVQPTRRNSKNTTTTTTT
jgi:hypothetical protein